MSMFPDAAQAVAIAGRLGFPSDGGEPLVLVERRGAALLWANHAASTMLGAADAETLRRRLFGTGLLLQRLGRLPAGGAGYRLERLPVPDHAQPLVLACYPVDDAGRALALLHLRSGPALAMPRRSPAPVEPDPSPAPDRESRPKVTRVLWETDAAGQLTEIGPEVARYLGTAAPQVGDDLADRLRVVSPALADQILAAAQGGNALPLSRFDWPLPDHGTHRPVEIGCTPKRGGPGLRGVLTLAGDPLPLPHRDAPQPVEPEAAPVVEPVPAEPEQALDLAPAQESHPDAAPPPPILEAEAEALPGPAPGGLNNIVNFPLMRLGMVPANFVTALRPAPAVGPAPAADGAAVDGAAAEPAGLSAPHWSEAPSWPEATPDGGPDGLSADERDAFEHIRKVLGTRPFATPPAAERPPASRPDPGLAGLQALLDLLPTGIRLDVNGVTLVNAALTALAGPEAATGPLPGERPLTGRDGAPLACDVSRFDLGGAPATLVVLEASRPAEAKPVDALDLVTDGHLRIDEAGLVAGASPKAARLLGRDARGLLGQPVAHVLAEGQMAVWQALAASAAGLEAPTQAPSALRLRGGSGQPLAVLARLGRDKGGLVCALTLDRPVAAPANDSVEAARREAERTSALKSEFLAKVSHEIRTPLNAILGFTEVIRDERLGPVGNARYLEYLRDIHSSGTHVMSLVNDLLDLSRIEAGRMDLRLEAVDANAIVQSCVNTLQTLAHRERVIVRLSLTPRLPRTLADERSLWQIVLNLLSNAVKFNEPGGQVIVSTALARPDAVAIRIRDTGIGMTEDEIEAAMEPFRQLSTVNRTGSGLGLPLTKALVEANCASMTIKSTRGEGTLVEVTFPLVEQDSMSLPAE